MIGLLFRALDLLIRIDERLERRRRARREAIEQSDRQIREELEAAEKRKQPGE